ncbi:Fic family protein [Paraliomyxa miuraensis]|uniref:Fic family protein n=1 Tax=Paraliomyxa miuraensis TaxID=376150 RepID=UPI002259C15A|nr:Fic family protein [Paraliomyxa miuraensis]MCX4241854.1 Fic family protein [Paraliomyxa miuraensis]
MRPYEHSHPWISFQFNAERLSQRTLLLLGEAHSKCSHIAGVPLTPGVAGELHRIYMAKGVGGTTAIEGNTLTEAQVREVLLGKLDLPPSQKYLQQEVENVAQACAEIGQKVLDGQAQLTVDWIKHLNRLVLRELPKEEHVVPGEIRGYSVGVLRYRGAPHEDCEHLLARMCRWFEEWPVKAWGTGSEIPTALLKAVLAHLYIAWIHPFGDGNGRTARLLEYYLLADAGVPSPAAHLLSNHYNLTRSEYYRHLDRASKSEQGVVEFIEYAVQGFVDGLHDELRVIRQQQWRMAWRDYVHEVFRGRRSESDQRQRDLLLALGLRAWEAVPRKDLPELTPEIVRWYATKTDRTLSRDLNTLVESGMVVRTDEGYRARLEIVLAFLPPRKPSEEELRDARRIAKELEAAGLPARGR